MYTSKVERAFCILQIPLARVFANISLLQLNDLNMGYHYNLKYLLLLSAEKSY